MNEAPILIYWYYFSITYFLIVKCLDGNSSANQPSGADTASANGAVCFHY